MNGLRIGSLFSGYGGLSLAVESALNGRMVWVADNDPGAARILRRRFPGVPNLGDLTVIDWAGVEPVDVIDGGSPCQDVSAAGKRAGMRAGNRSGLWASMCDAVDIIRPRFVVWENVRGALSAPADSGLEPCPICVGNPGEPDLRALGRVLGDLADLGYDAAWCALRAADIGAPHARERIFVLAWPADSQSTGLEGSGRSGDEPQVAGPEFPALLAADADDIGPVRSRQARGRRERPAHHGQLVPDATRDGRDQGRTEPAGQLRRPDAALRGAPAVAWGHYATAIHRWERVLDRSAPHPTELTPRGGQRLAPAFVEWMQGLPPGWVTDVPGLSRNDQLKALGNGVVPQQGSAALRYLLRFAPPVPITAEGAAA